MATWTVREVLGWTTRDLTERGSSSARLDAEVLLADVLGVDRMGLYLDHDRFLTEDERARYRESVGRRRTGEPVAYITGRKEFWSLGLAVDRRVLIPRPETEILVEEALAALGPAREGGRGLDVGTGSGAIAIAILADCPAMTFDAVDRSPDALDVAKANADRHGVSDRLQLRAGNLAEPTAAEPPFDLVTANLPYIASGELQSLPTSVRDFEPHAALDGGPDGLDLIRELVRGSGSLLVKGGVLVLEIGSDQAPAVARDIEAQPELLLEKVRKDYAGRDRVVVVRRR